MKIGKITIIVFVLMINSFFSDFVFSQYTESDEITIIPPVSLKNSKPPALKEKRMFDEVYADWIETVNIDRKKLICENMLFRINEILRVGINNKIKEKFSQIYELKSKFEILDDSTLVTLLMNLADIEKEYFDLGFFNFNDLNKNGSIEASVLGCAGANSTVCGEIVKINSRIYNSETTTWYKEGGYPGSGYWFFTDITVRTNGTYSSNLDMFVEVINEPSGWDMFWVINPGVYQNRSPTFIMPPYTVGILNSGNLQSFTQSPNSSERSTSVTYRLYWDRNWPLANELLHTYSEQIKNDVTLPDAYVITLPATTTSTTFTVSWTGSDPGIGASGIKNYDVQYRINNGSWQNWQNQTTNTSATFSGMVGNTYYFQARATDNVGHIENFIGGNGDTYTTVVQQQRTVTTSSNPSNGGTTTGGGTYNVGASVTVTATANSGFTFTNWTEGGSVVSTSASYQFTMPNNNRNLVANFSVIQRTVTTSSNPSNGGTTTGGGTYNVGASVTVTATANSGFTFTNWTEGGSVVSTSASYQFTMPNNNRNLVANFSVIQRTVTTSSNPSNGGTTTGGGTYNVGASVTVTATANSGFTFTNWTEGGSVVSTSASYQFTMPNNNRNLVANFSVIQRTVTTSSNPSNGGTTTGGGTYNVGASVTVTATANSGFTFTNWTEGGSVVSTSASYQFTMPNNNRNLVANFSVINITVTPSVINYGQVNQGSVGVDTIIITNGPNSTSNLTGNIGIYGDGFAIFSGGGNFEINPGQQSKVVVWFAPSTQNNYSGEVIITHNAGNEINPKIILLFGNGVTGIEDLFFLNSIPDEYNLSNNFPNPFNPSTRIEFGLPEPSTITLSVYDVLANEVKAILENQSLPAGNFSYDFIANNLASGVYICVLTASSNISNLSFRDTKKMLLIR